ncbi:MAG: hypothetical protein AB7S74_05845 [Hyphomicrobium sp.]
MTTRAYIAFALALMVNAVVFGVGAITVLSVPALSGIASYLLPAIIAFSIIITPFISWRLAPNLRTRPARTTLRQR